METTQAENTPKRKRKAPSKAWQPGQSGNPKGRPIGARNRATLLAAAMLDSEVEAITKAVIDAAKSGDMTAARICLERLVPPMRERPIRANIPSATTAPQCTTAQAAILSAVVSGELMPGEGQALSAMVENQRRAIETTELEQRIAALESRQA